MVTAKDSLAKIDGYNKQISDNTSLLNSYQVQLSLEDKTTTTTTTDTKTESKDIGYGGTERTAITNFTNRSEGASLKFGLVVIEGDDDWGEEETYLYVFADGQTSANDIGFNMSNAYTVTGKGLKAAGTDISKGKDIKEIYIYYAYPVLNEDKSAIREWAYDKVLYTLPTPDQTNTVLFTALKNAIKELPDPKKDYVTITTTTTTSTTTTTPNERYTKLLKEIAKLKTENSKTNALLNGSKWTIYSVDEEKNEEVSEESSESIAIGCLAYKKLSIENSFEMTDATFTLGDWGTGYTINGNGNVITYNSTAEGKLINENNGAINNLGVINGKIAEVNNNSVKIAFETENTEDGLKYDIYDASGVHTESLMNGELAYRARPYFGVTIDENGTFGTLAKKTANNTVYKAEWTDTKTKETETFYTNATATDLSHNPAAGKVNTFVYVLDSDLSTTNRLTEATNVIVNGKCKTAVFTDGVEEGDEGYIYIPKAFTAENLSYTRNFSSSALATVCLPFTVPSTIFETLGIEKTMQFFEVEAATNTYWFQYQKGSTNANEPYVLKFKEGFQGGQIFGNLTNISVATTKDIANRFAVAPSNPGTGAEFLGVFVSTNATELAKGGYTLYGFAEGKFRPMKAVDTNPCPAFRTFVRARNTGNAPAEVFNIGELDEDGNIVSDGGETAISTAEADAFSVRGINGALVITSDKAQKVNIYTIGGSLVKATNVEAGTVTVPVAAGMYIVNGKKVFVK